jgi:hypothetical protein
MRTSGLSVSQEGWRRFVVWRDLRHQNFHRNLAQLCQEIQDLDLTKSGCLANTNRGILVLILNSSYFKDQFKQEPDV